MLGRVRRWLSRRKTERLTLREWDAAKTHRLNTTHWSDADGRTLNTSLVGTLPTLCYRSRHEARSNPAIEGIIRLHTCHVVGADGPTLQVQTDDPSYNDALEDLWSDWWSMPDYNGRLPGVDMLHQAWRGMWTDGGFIHQIVTDGAASGPIKQRLLPITMARLDTPPERTGRTGITLGVERTPTGRVTGYWFANTVDDGLGAIYGGYSRVPAADVLHLFDQLEPEQARGFPWLASALQGAADLADYDQQVLDAARQAADMAVLLYTIDPRAKFLPINESTDIERSTIRTIPPGYQATQLQPQQPASNYNEYRAERHADMGRGQGIPGMIARQDAQNHNYSSARFDSQGYNRMIKLRQATLARMYLNRLVELVRREGELSGVLPRPPRGRVKFKWNWSAPPHVDPLKEALAATERLANGTSSLAIECPAAGSGDWQDNFTQRRLEREMAEANGLEIVAPRKSARRADVMADLSRAVRAGVPVSVSEARALGLGLPEDPPEGQTLLRFNDQDILAYHIEAGVLTINEARKRLNLPPVDWGDVPVRRTGIVAVESGSRESETEDDADDVAAGDRSARRNGYHDRIAIE